MSSETASACRFCRTPLRHTVVDLGTSPLCEHYIAPAAYRLAEATYPLHAFVCHACFLVQVDEFVPREAIFSEYAYFSSYSDSWVAHARRYCEMMGERLGLSERSHVVELASNDGYLLQHFVEMGVPCTGIEPAANVARVAQQRGVETITDFFGLELATTLRARGIRPDLVVGNNVLAQVPDLHDFVAGIKVLLAEAGVATLEFPHLLELLDGVQFDTIYHEHYSYFSLLTAEAIFAEHGLRLFDVEQLATHGGSLRIFACHEACAELPTTDRYRGLLELEARAGLRSLQTYEAFSKRVGAVKAQIVEFFLEAQKAGKKIVGYGAPGKANTLLNYCGIKADWLRFTCDRNPYKQGMYLPGSRVPVRAPEAIDEARPDYVVIMPWNLRDEIAPLLSHVAGWGGKLVTLVPSVHVFEP